MSGRWLILATLVVCLSLVCFALWRRSRDTAQVREFWGSSGASLIQHAPTVAVRLISTSQGSDLPLIDVPLVDVPLIDVPSSDALLRDAPLIEERSRWLDLSTAPGLVHLRATLVDDRYFQWPSRAATAGEVAAGPSRWRVLRFSSTSGFVDTAIDLERGTIVNLMNSRAVDILPSSRQAIAAYLELEAPAVSSGGGGGAPSH